MNSRLFRRYSKRFNFFQNLIFIFIIIVISKFILIQVIFPSSYQDSIIQKTVALVKDYGIRGDILDRNRKILASSVYQYKIWINTIKNDFNKEEIFFFLKKHFNTSREDYENLFSNKSNYLVLKNKVAKNKVNTLSKDITMIKGLNITRSPSRIYPYNELAAQVIGFTDYKNKGLYGIENYYNHTLSGQQALVEYGKNSRGRITKNLSEPPKNGADILLTIDIELQKILQNQLALALKENNARSANGIIINPNNGEILALANLPHFDLNNYNNLPIDSANQYYTNNLISRAYEPGSIFKIICFTEAIENYKDIISNSYYCENGLYNGIYNKGFKDHKQHDELSFVDIFTVSSNIGTIKVFEDLDKEFYYKRIKKFGFGNKTNINLPDEHHGKIWEFSHYSKNPRDLASSTLGQAILATNIQMAIAYASIANGGYILKPQIIKKIVYDNYIEEYNNPIIVRRSMTSSTSQILLDMLEDVVTNGTGKEAYIENMDIGGKTGTAQVWNKIESRYSDNQYISSFASVFPISNPQYVIIISIESPEYDKRWGGESAAPCTRNIIEEILFYDFELLNKLSMKYEIT